MHKSEIIEYLNIASELISEAYSKDSNSDVFEQAGILSGREIVLDYINHGELAVAVEHLLYMVHESGISFPEEKLSSLHKLARNLKVPNGYVSSNTNKQFKK